MELKCLLHWLPTIKIKKKQDKREYIITCNRFVCHQDELKAQKGSNTPTMIVLHQSPTIPETKTLQTRYRYTKKKPIIEYKLQLANHQVQTKVAPRHSNM